MAPLGTDAEAGGATTGAEDIARLTEQETPSEAARRLAQPPRAGGRLQLVPWPVVSQPLTAIAALRIAA